MPTYKATIETDEPIGQFTGSMVEAFVAGPDGNCSVEIEKLED